MVDEDLSDEFVEDDDIFWVLFFDSIEFFWLGEGENMLLMWMWSGLVLEICYYLFLV